MIVRLLLAAVVAGLMAGTAIAQHIKYIPQIMLAKASVLGLMPWHMAVVRWA